MGIGRDIIEMSEGTASKLTAAQLKEIQKELIKDGVPVRFMKSGKALNIETGQWGGKGTNVMYQMGYWSFTKKTAKKVAGWLGVKAVF